MTAGPRPVRAPRGTTLSALSWQTEAPLRMLMNNLDPEVASDPTTCGGLRRHRQGGAQLGGVRRRFCATLRTLKADETMLVQSGKPVGVMAHARVGAARAHRQQQPRARLGETGRSSGASTTSAS